ncbi:HIT family protein [Saliphagus sp. GCM10025308]
MDRVFAPWRMDWITRDDEDFDGCVFCNLPDQDADRENRIVARSSDAYAVLNKSPYTPGHLLVLPFSHTGEIENIKLDDFFDVFKLVQLSVRAVKTALAPDGFNIGMNIGEAGGASITDHVHVHVVPRWNGDTTFMPTTANSKVVAEALDETYSRLREAFTELNCGTETDPDSAILVS